MSTWVLACAACPFPYNRSCPDVIVAFAAGCGDAGRPTLSKTPPEQAYATAAHPKGGMGETGTCKRGDQIPQALVPVGVAPLGTVGPNVPLSTARSRQAQAWLPGGHLPSRCDRGETVRVNALALVAGGRSGATCAAPTPGARGQASHYRRRAVQRSREALRKGP